MPKTLIFAIFILLIGLYCIIWAIMAFRTYRFEISDEQKQFMQGKPLTELPDGFYKGTVKNYSGGWKGKTFDRSAKSGNNLISEKNVYPFHISQANGLRDPDIKTVRIDYNRPENPWYLRHLIDEVVQTAPGKLQGKIMVRWLGSTFTVGYFQLEQ